MDPTSRPTSHPAAGKAGANEPSRYELIWQLAHSGLEPDDAIDAVAYVFGVPHGVASGLVWAEMARPVASRPSAQWDERPLPGGGLWRPLDDTGATDGPGPPGVGWR